MLPRLRFFVEQALSGLWRSIGVSALAIITIGIALGLLASFLVVIENLRRLVDEIGSDVEISAYLSRSLPPSRGRALAQKVSGWPEVERAWSRTSSEAFAAFGDSLGKDRVIIEGLPNDLLPASIEVRLTKSRWTAAEVRTLADRLGKLEGVEDVRYGQDDLERLQAILSFARLAALVIGAVICLGVVMVVSNTIRLTVYARRDEIEIMSLIGATDMFVRAPFVIEGAIQGALGAMFATLSLYALRGALLAGIRQGLSYAVGPVELDVVPVELVGLLLSVGVVLGLLGSLLAVGKFVRA